MNEEELRKLIKEELHLYFTRNQYGVSRIAAHNHNGIDSLRVDANTLEYAKPFFKLFQVSTTPTSLVAGAIACVNNTLYICDGTSWIKVGAQ